MHITTHREIVSAEVEELFFEVVVVENNLFGLVSIMALSLLVA